MRQCSKCKEWKDETEFYKDKSRKDGLRRVCKTCWKENNSVVNRKYNAERCKAYREKNKDVLREKQHDRFEKYQAFLDTLKRDCVKCGESRRYIIQFHHVNCDDKRFNITTMHSQNTVMEEIKKCVCLCSNCHDEYHWLYGKQPHKPVETLTEYLGRNPYEI